MLLAWIHAVHHFGHNRLRGLAPLSIVLPLLVVLLYVLDRWLASSLIDGQSQGVGSFWFSLIADGRLYSAALFEIWQLWTYVFYHGDLLHLLANLFFLIPIMLYWERYFGSWFVLCLLIILPVSVVLLVITEVLPGGADVGSSPLVVALYAGALLHARDMTATVMLMSWWGTAVRLRRLSCALYWVLLVYVVLDLLLVSWRRGDAAFSLLYLANLLIAACAGVSAFTVLEHLRERLGLQTSPDSGA